ncbi:LPS export ABC transporter permease LptG [Marinicella litoralis]|uniref:Lipopolysaccharide export system permease protein n=1 Tax=Marinicella litoralis TaxID=644220 RepID=A0A4R6XMG6_9GAMM|nr:LPS export ABC transporter permease LptG [Marinicella litoralis]TDR20786.1 lipopolysaccharide export system permease protein [Marinicella litoralis]
MSILSKYIFKTLSFGLMVAVFLLLSIDVLFNLIKELNDINSVYTLGDVFFFVMLTIPSKIYEMFPVSVVVAVVVSLGALANGSELVVMLASGVSKLRIAVTVLFSVGFWLVLVVLMGEYIASTGDQMAQQFRNEQVSKGKATSAAHAIWLRDGDVIFRTNRMTEQEQKGVYELHEVTVFELENKKLKQVSEAKSAVFENQQWTLKDLKVSTFTDDGVSTNQHAEQSWDSRIQPEILNISTTRPKYLSIRDINKFQNFNASTGALQSAYHIAWWSKLSFPLLVFATALCGVIMLFGQVRSGGFAQRLVVGIVIGVVVYLLNKTLLNFGEVYHVHPFWVAMLPALLLFVFLILWLAGRFRA